MRILPSDRDNEPRLWVPLVDGADRLGVLQARLDSAAELYDTALREQLSWVASLLGHLIASIGRLRRRARALPAQSPAGRLGGADLAAAAAADRGDRLLRTGGHARAQLRGRRGRLRLRALRAHGVAGDLRRRGPRHRASLMAAATLAGYRSVRRDGRSVYDQARSIDEVIGKTFCGQSVSHRHTRRGGPGFGPAALRERRPPATTAAARGQDGEGTRTADGGGRSGWRRTGSPSRRRTWSLETGSPSTPTGSRRRAMPRAAGSARIGSWTSSPARWRRDSRPRRGCGGSPRRC